MQLKPLTRNQDLAFVLLELLQCLPRRTHLTEDLPMLSATPKKDSTFTKEESY